MKCILFSGNQEIRIDAANLEEANLSEYNSLGLHLLDSVVVVIPGEMTGKELIRASQSLQPMASELLMAIVKVCIPCNSCRKEALGELMTDTILPEVAAPYEELIKRGIAPESKLSCEADPGSHRIFVFEAESVSRI